MKIRVSLTLEFNEVPDDEGSVDHWLASAILDGLNSYSVNDLETDEFMEKYKVEWEEVDPNEIQALTK